MKQLMPVLVLLAATVHAWPAIGQPRPGTPQAQPGAAQSRTNDVPSQPGAAAPPAADVPVMMSVDDQRRMGVESAVLEAREIRASVDAVVRVIDPGPLAMLDSDLAAAVVAAASSAAELERTAGLAAQDQSASQQALEAARARAAADRAQLTRLRQRLSIEWSPAIAGLSADERADLIAAVAAGRAALLRADVPDRPDGIEGRMLIESPDRTESIDRGAPIEAEPLGLSGTADARMQTVGLFGIARGAPAAGLRPGRVFPGRIETDTTVAGVVLPRSALVRLDGAVWAYVRTGDEMFARREVPEPRLLDSGWFVTSRFAPGMALVVRGAGSLVALERTDEAVEAD